MAVPIAVPEAKAYENPADTENTIEGLRKLWIKLKESSMQELLERMLSHVIDQQKFSEGKNALLATVSGLGGMAMIPGIENRNLTLPFFEGRLALIPVVLFLMASALAFWGIIPRAYNAIGKKRELTGRENLLFFGDLRWFTEESLLTTVKEAIGDKKEATRLERNFANQIIVNSEITANKLWHFKIASGFVIAGLLSAAGLSLCGCF